jgi:hypothetical protein
MTTTILQLRAFIRALGRQIDGPGFYPLGAECEAVAALESLAAGRGIYACPRSGRKKLQVRIVRTLR